jgi:hypothetical protein
VLLDVPVMSAGALGYTFYLQSHCDAASELNRLLQGSLMVMVARAVFLLWARATPIRTNSSAP